MSTAQTERNSLRVMGLAGFASMASMRLCDPMLVVLGQEFHVTTGEASRVVSAFAVAYGVLQLFYGPLGDRFGKLRVISLAVLACAVFSAITSMASDLTLLVVMRGFMGAAAAGIIPLSMAWIGDQVAYDRRQETLAKLMGYTVTGMMAGLWFGGFAAEHLGWRAAFAVVSVLFASVAFMLWRKLRSMPSASSAASASSFAAYFANTLEMLRVARVRQVLIVTAIEGALVFGAMAFIPTHLHQQFDMSVVLAGSVMMLYGVGGLLYSQFARRWLTWLGGERGLVKTGVTCIVLGLLILAWAREPAWGMLGCFATGFGFYMLHNTLQVQATQMAPASRGTAVTLFACLLFFGQSSGVVLMAQSVDRDWLPGTLSLAAMGVAVLGFFVYRLVGRH
ncbi:MFS transporter [Limnohabitans sp. Hippo3]|uniref:MFS transporter n=1 Tax=Limnohabitans sp. Hippo3 TaxID=1597956 RepID=UPI000D3CB734|nr:MFS transporter [Limnohabitans sp. Hippo3]PUE43950.1 MFS transporter [Limnohabitans sp. Hippo3]